MRGVERIEAGKLSEKQQFKLRIRRLSTITVGNRVVYGGTNYDIIDVEDNHRDGDMILFCREAVS